MFGFIKNIIGFLFKTTLRAILTIIVLVVVGFFAYKTFGNSKQQVQYQTAQVTKDTLVVSVSESGQMVSTGSLPVTTLASGVVSKVLVKNGETVTQGQEIMDIIPDQTTIQNQTQALASYQQATDSYNAAIAAKTSSQATLEKDRATVITASSNVDIADNLASAKQPNPATGSMYSQNDLNVIHSTLTSARETFTADEAKYNQADANIAAAQTAMTSALQSYQQSSTKVVAPASGTITDIIYAPGMAISAGSATVTTGTGSSSNSTSRSTSTIGEIETSNNTIPVATFNLSEVDMPKVKAGQHATITLDALPNKTFTGTVIGVNREGSVSSGVTNYPVTIQLDSSYPDLATNMSATANIIIQTKPDVLLVPSAAVQTSSGQSTVRVLKNGKVSTVTVEVGDSSDSQTEITSGLSEGDTVVTSISSTTNSSSTSSSPFSGSIFGGGRGGAVIRTGRGG